VSGKHSLSIVSRLKAAGVAGVLSYGLLNTLYYAAGFLSLWLHVGAFPAGTALGFTARRLAEVAALLWLGSQATKPLRLAGALLLSPLARRLLDAVTRSLPADKQSESLAFTLCVLACFSVFGGLVLTVFLLS
jgi:hypothetical protein